MITNETTVGDVQIRTTWDGLSGDEATLEEIYWFLFHNEYNHVRTILPSICIIDSITQDGEDYIKKNFVPTLICARDYWNVYKKSKTQFSLDALDKENEVFFHDSTKDRVNIYRLNHVDFEYPVLLRLGSENGKHFDCRLCSFNYDDIKKISDLLKEKYPFKPDYEKSIMFGVLFSENNRISIKELPLDDDYVKNMNLDFNYGEGFKKIHTGIIDKINNHKRGLFIFHGIPGTGKTTYIKYLANYFGGKRMFIFIPTNCLNELASPSILPILLDHKDSILILEDAEKAVVSRENELGNESLVSSLLNIGDGILGSMLNLSVILTFNTGKNKVDEALLRKGRLLYEYEFTSLSIDDSNILLKKIGKDFITDKEMSLAEIYNLEVDTGHKVEERRKVGF